MNGLAKTLLAFLVCAGTALAGGKPTVKAVFASGDVPLPRSGARRALRPWRKTRKEKACPISTAKSVCAGPGTIFTFYSSVLTTSFI
jgi:hypothetical protein